MLSVYRNLLIVMMVARRLGDRLLAYHDKAAIMNKHRPDQAQTAAEPSRLPERKHEAGDQPESRDRHGDGDSLAGWAS